MLLKKTCKICEETKVLEEFYKDSRVKNGRQSKCKTCHKKAMAKWREENPEKKKELSYEWYKKNQEKLREKDRQRRKNNPEKFRGYSKTYYEKNKEKILDKNRKWVKDNPKCVYKKYKKWRESNLDKVNALQAKYRSSKKNATPSWLTKEDFEKIQTFYSHAKECEMLTGDQYHVDHIIPLQGENVSGLHVPWNLQVLPADINLSKGNRVA